MRTPERDREQPQHPTTVMTGQPSTHTKPTPKADDKDEDSDKYQGLTVTENYDGATQHLPHAVDLGCLLLIMTPVLTPTPHACTSSQPPNMRSTLHESFYCTALRNCSKSACSRVGMGVWCWCFGDAVSPVYVHCGTLLINLGVVVFLYECGVCG